MNANASPFVMPVFKMNADATPFTMPATPPLKAVTAHIVAPAPSLGTVPVETLMPASGALPAAVVTPPACNLTLPGIARREAAPRPPPLTLIDSPAEDYHEFTWTSAVSTPAHDALPTPAATAAMQLLRRQFGTPIANALSPNGKVLCSPSVTSPVTTFADQTVAGSAASFGSQNTSLFSGTSSRSPANPCFSAHVVESPNHDAVMQLSQHSASMFFPPSNAEKCFLKEVDLPTPAAVAAMKFIRRATTSGPTCKSTVACTVSPAKCTSPGSFVIFAPPGSAAEPAPISALHVGTQLRPTSDCARTAPSAGAPGAASKTDANFGTQRTQYSVLGRPVAVLAGLPSAPLGLAA